MGLYERHIFPRLLDFVMSRAQMTRERKRALADARGDVLEIGFGTGLNLPHYPPTVVRLSTVDVHVMLDRIVARRIENAAMPVERHTLDAATLPFDAGRFDCVVSTWTLCSIDDVASALAEVRRVLKPGGRFLFVEHGRSDAPAVARWQDRLNGIQRRLAGGCNLNRPIDRLIDEAGLRIERLDRFCMPRRPRLLGEHYLGQARPA